MTIGSRSGRPSWGPAGADIDDGGGDRLSRCGWGQGTEKRLDEFEVRTCAGGLSISMGGDTWWFGRDVQWGDKVDVW